MADTPNRTSLPFVSVCSEFFGDMAGVSGQSLLLHMLRGTKLSSGMQQEKNGNEF